jgi:hypothetical protein
MHADFYLVVLELAKRKVTRVLMRENGAASGYIILRSKQTDTECVSEKLRKRDLPTK